MTELTSLLGEALAKASATEDAITEMLAHMVLEREHPHVRRTGTYAFQVSRLKGELAEAQAVTDALRVSLARAADHSKE